MLEFLFGEHAKHVKTVLKFIFGEWHKSIGALYLSMVLNGIIEAIKVKVFRKSFGAFMEKLFAYSAFLIVGNIVDNLVVDSLTGWTGSTKFLICIYLVTKEVRAIAAYLNERHGIRIPILEERLNQLDVLGQQQPSNGLNAPLDTQIDTLRQQLLDLESLKTQEGSTFPIKEDPKD